MLAVHVRSQALRGRERHKAERTLALVTSKVLLPAQAARRHGDAAAWQAAQAAAKHVSTSAQRVRLLAARKATPEVLRQVGALPEADLPPLRRAQRAPKVLCTVVLEQGVRIVERLLAKGAGLVRGCATVPCQPQCRTGVLRMTWSLVTVHTQWLARCAGVPEDCTCLRFRTAEHCTGPPPANLRESRRPAWPTCVRPVLCGAPRLQLSREVAPRLQQQLAMGEQPLKACSTAL